MTVFINFFCLCPLGLIIKLNFNISIVDLATLLEAGPLQYSSSEIGAIERDTFFCFISKLIFLQLEFSNFIISSSVRLVGLY